eukprot:COSAG04_NODE_7228_length_1164_cov_1.667606_2_plen_94_part_00
MAAPLDAEAVRSFADDGFLIRRSLFTPEEVGLLSQLSHSSAPRSHGRGGNAQEEGRQSEFWMLPGPDPEAPSVFDAVCFATRMTGTLSALLEE